MPTTSVVPATCDVDVPPGTDVEVDVVVSVTDVVVSLLNVVVTCGVVVVVVGSVVVDGDVLVVVQS